MRNSNPRQGTKKEVIMCSALKEVNIPAGPRLIILHHLDRYRHVLKPGMPIPTPQQMPSQQPQLQKPAAQPRR
jgi:hypothetical protein